MKRQSCYTCTAKINLNHLFLYSMIRSQVLRWTRCSGRQFPLLGNQWQKEFVLHFRFSGHRNFYLYALSSCRQMGVYIHWRYMILFVQSIKSGCKSSVWFLQDALLLIILTTMHWMSTASISRANHRQGCTTAVIHWQHRQITTSSWVWMENLFWTLLQRSW